jgi:hypothetical protein
MYAKGVHIEAGWPRFNFGPHSWFALETLRGNGGTWLTLMHTFEDPDSASDGENLFIGEGSGNYTMAAVGSTIQASHNTGIGASTLRGCSTCNRNTANGHGSMPVLTTGQMNNSFGSDSMFFATSAERVNAFGRAAVSGCTDCKGVIGFGDSAGAVEGILTTADDAMFIGDWASFLSNRQTDNAWAIGADAKVDLANAGVFGVGGMTFSFGGVPNPDRTVLVADVSSLGVETLSEADFVTHANWTTVGDFDDTNENCAYAHSGGSGTCTQATGDFAAAAVGGAFYHFQFTVSGHAGNPACSITTFPGVTYTIFPTTPPDGTRAVYFRSDASPGNFVISCISDSGDDAIVFDDVSLMQVTDGDIEAIDDLRANDVIFRSDTSFTGTLAHTNTANRIYTFPDVAAAISYTVASGTAVLNTAQIVDGACATVVTETATGTATTDVIAFSPNATLAAVTGYNPSGDLLYIMEYPTADNVNFLVCNSSGNAVTPGAVTLNWRVTR